MICTQCEPSTQPKRPEYPKLLKLIPLVGSDSYIVLALESRGSHFSGVVLESSIPSHPVGLWGEAFISERFEPFSGRITLENVE